MPAVRKCVLMKRTNYMMIFSAVRQLNSASYLKSSPHFVTQENLLVVYSNVPLTVPQNWFRISMIVRLFSRPVF